MIDVIEPQNAKAEAGIAVSLDGTAKLPLAVHVHVSPPLPTQLEGHKEPVAEPKKQLSRTSIDIRRPCGAW